MLVASSEVREYMKSGLTLEEVAKHLDLYILDVDLLDSAIQPLINAINQGPFFGTAGKSNEGRIKLGDKLRIHFIIKSENKYQIGVENYGVEQ